ncbi:MAG: helix-turn-helix transcriptional regulator [Eubacteriales bacterium]|nr:helix-turn-helix transcriptional regulator [Eubacteriales bacterium]
MNNLLSWDGLKREMSALSQEEKDEIALKVEIIGKFLEIRKHAGLTQVELENLTGVKQSFIARLENNHNDPRLTTILKLLRPLGMTLSIVPIEKVQNTGQENI